LSGASAHHEEVGFVELDVVRTVATLEVEGHVLPSGTLGAIVLVHDDGRAFEVEFMLPIPAVVTLARSDLEHVV
jgi:hypothetical protein